LAKPTSFNQLTKVAKKIQSNEKEDFQSTDQSCKKVLVSEKHDF
jgi:hypothetical protein